MEGVEAVTGAIGQAESVNEEAVASEKAEGQHGAGTAVREAPPEDGIPAPHFNVQEGVIPMEGRDSNPWTTLIDAGLKLMETLAATRVDGTPPPSWVETDPESGKSYLKLPIPEPETMERLAGALSALLGELHRK